MGSEIGVPVIRNVPAVGGGSVGNNGAARGSWAYVGVAHFILANGLDFVQTALVQTGIRHRPRKV